MSKTLVLAEKPSVARDIARVLGVRGASGSTADGFMESDDWIVTWALGHLVALSEPDAIDPRYKAWRMDTLPMLPDDIPLRVIEKTKKQFGVVKKLMHRRDVGQIVCATDSGREGELIFRYIYKQAECKKPFSRLWISSMTDEAISEGFAHLRPGSDYDNLYESARCRSEADWLVGMNASRAYSIRYNAWLSVGRVQTPTLSLICARDTEISDFKPEDYFEVRALFGASEEAAMQAQAVQNIQPHAQVESAASPISPVQIAARIREEVAARKNSLDARPGEYTGVWLGTAEKNPTRISDESTARTIADEVRGKSAAIESVTRQDQQTLPPLLYDLTSLQRDANRLMGLSAKQTLDAAQALYERHKLITYPRTDSRHLTHDMAAQLPAVISALPAEYGELVSRLPALDNIGANIRIFDDSKVSDHHALLPTRKQAHLNMLPPAERGVYDLIVRRLLAALYPPYKFIKSEIFTRAESHKFVSRGIAPVDMGWKAVYRGVDEDEREPVLPDVRKGDVRVTLSSQAQAKKTQPPKPYTDATLLQAMENVGRTIVDEELKQAMKDSGLGTPATRAATIERLIEVGYVSRSGKSLKTTPKAQSLMKILPEQLLSAETTGKWERALGRIARGEGQITPQAFLDSIRRFSAFIVENAKTSQTGVEFEKQDASPKRTQQHYLTGAKCPQCGGRILESARAFGCEHWREGCKFTIWKDALSRQDANMPAITATAAKKLLKGEDAVVGKKLVRILNGRPCIVGDAPPKPPLPASSRSKG